MDCQALLRVFFLYLVHVFVKMKKEKEQIKDLNVSKKTEHYNLGNIKIITGILLVGENFFFGCNKI